MNDNNPLHRAARLVAAAYFRYPGIVPHHSSCDRLPFMNTDCACGASYLNEALDILKYAFKASGDHFWNATSEELSTEMAALLDKLQTEEKCSVCQNTRVIKVNHCTDCGCADVGVGVIHHPNCGEEQCPSCGGKSGTTL